MKFPEPPALHFFASQDGPEVEDLNGDEKNEESYEDKMRRNEEERQRQEDDETKTGTWWE